MQVDDNLLLYKNNTVYITLFYSGIVSVTNVEKYTVVWNILDVWVEKGSCINDYIVK